MSCRLAYRKIRDRASHFTRKWSIKTRNALIKVIRADGKSQATAEDIAHDCFEAALEAGAKCLCAYARKALEHIVYNRTRDRRRHKEWLEQYHQSLEPLEVTGALTEPEAAAALSELDRHVTRSRRKHTKAAVRHRLDGKGEIDRRRASEEIAKLEAWYEGAEKKGVKVENRPDI